MTAAHAKPITPLAPTIPLEALADPHALIGADLLDGAGDFYSESTHRLLDETNDVAHAHDFGIFNSPEASEIPETDRDDGGIEEQGIDDDEPRDALGIYLSDITSTTFIEHKDELVLGKQIHEGKEQILRLIMATPLFLSWLHDVRKGIDSGRLRFKKIITPTEKNGFVNINEDKDGTNARRLDYYAKRVRRLYRTYSRCQDSDPNRSAKLLGQSLAVVDEMNFTVPAIAQLHAYVYDKAARLDAEEKTIVHLFNVYRQSCSRKGMQSGSASRGDFTTIMRTKGASEVIAQRYSPRLGIPDEVLDGYISTLRRNRDCARADIARMGLTKARLHELRDNMQREQRAIDRAKQKLIRAHLPFVVHVVKPFRFRGMDFSDLIQEGNIGLMRAIDRYDYRRGYRLLTYAYWWIKQAVQHAMPTGANTIRVPYQYPMKHGQLNVASAKLYIELDRHPTMEELAAELGWTVDEVEQCLNMVQQPISLTQPLTESGEFTLMDIVSDPRSDTPFRNVISTQLERRVSAMLAMLPSTLNEAILRKRFGFEDGEKLSLKVIGKQYGWTSETIRLREEKAKKWLRDENQALCLDDLLDP